MTSLHGLPGAPDLTEQTLIAVKPDGVQRRLVGKIIQRFEQRGFKLVGLKMMRVCCRSFNHTNPSISNWQPHLTVEF